VPPRDWRERLADIREAVDRIAEYTHGMTAESFSSNRLVVDAVVRNLTVIGEAARGVPPEVEARLPDLPWLEMRGLRNLVVHRYFGVDLAVLWQTVCDDLPALGAKVDQALRD
jgi:uncharacterized protein with HEPN domain